MTDSKKRAGRPIKAPAPWGELARSAGGSIKLAESLGVAYSTLYKWSLGTHRIPKLVRKELLGMCQQHGITEGVEVLQHD